MPVSPEAFLISSILRDRDMPTAIAAGMTDEMFRAFPEEWVFLTTYQTKHKKTPSKMAFKSKFPDFHIKSVNDTEHFAEEVRKAYAKRMLTLTMRSAATHIADGELTEAVDLFQQKIVQIGSAMNGVRDSNLSEDWKSTFDEVAERVRKYDEDGFAGIPTGFETFDDRTGGMQPGQLIIVGARMGEGKSLVLQRMAVSNIMDGHSAHIASLEMKKVEVEMRIHGMLSGLVGQSIFNSMNLYTGQDIDLIAYKKFLRSLKTSLKGQLTVSDTRNIGIAEIAAHIERYKPSVYYLDYLTLAKMSGEGSWFDIGKFTKSLKDLAGDTNTTIVAAAQLNREAAKGVKDVASVDTLSGSDQIAMDADGVINLRRRSARITEYQAVKFRQVSSGFKWYAHMDPTKGIFEEVTGNEAKRIMDLDRDLEDLQTVSARRQKNEEEKSAPAARPRVVKRPTKSLKKSAQ